MDGTILVADKAGERGAVELGRFAGSGSGIGAPPGMAGPPTGVLIRGVDDRRGDAVDAGRNTS